MYELLVECHIKEAWVADFLQATLENAKKAQQEPGFHAFRILQDSQRTNRFYFFETYDSEAAANAHLETPWYKKWKSTVEDTGQYGEQGMFLEPRGNKVLSQKWPL